MKWIIEAEHCHGGSVSHSCATGIIDDPTDWITGHEVEADTEGLAEHLAWAKLNRRVETMDQSPCECGKSAYADIGDVTIRVSSVCE